MGKRNLDSVLDGEADEKDRSLKMSEGGASDEEFVPEVKVVGEIIKKAGGKLKGDKGRKMYQAFEVDGNRYEVDDPVLVTPERPSQKPYVAIIKKVMHAKDGTVQVEGQWFYRPEEAEKKGGGTWASATNGMAELRRRRGWTLARALKLVIISVHHPAERRIAVPCLGRIMQDRLSTRPRISKSY